jgi:6-phosphogluconolactonase
MNLVMREIRVMDTEVEAARNAAAFVYELITDHHEPRRFNLALSGGNTPKQMYRQLAEMPDCGALLAERAEIFFSDERAVPPDSNESNYHAARVELFEPLGLPTGIVHRMQGEAADIRLEARRYAELIRQKVSGSESNIPEFDLILLGIGSDGHTASLFPELNFETGSRELVQAYFVESLQAWRYTFSLPLINSARAVVFLVTGQEKAVVVRKILSADSGGCTLPAARVKAAKTVWIMDQSAAADLER